MTTSRLITISIQIVISSFMIATAFGQQSAVIYDDPAQFETVRSNIDNIEKALNEIKVLSADPNRDYNKLVGWINLKNDQIDELSEIMAGYFMAQRLTPVPPDSREFGDYLKQLRLFKQPFRQALQENAKMGHHCI